MASIGEQLSLESPCYIDGFFLPEGLSLEEHRLFLQPKPKETAEKTNTAQAALFKEFVSGGGWLRRDARVYSDSTKLV